MENGKEQYTAKYLEKLVSGYLTELLIYTYKDTYIILCVLITKVRNAMLLGTLAK